mgnify:FL=1
MSYGAAANLLAEVVLIFSVRLVFFFAEYGLRIYHNCNVYSAVALRVIDSK